MINMVNKMNMVSMMNMKNIRSWRAQGYISFCDTLLGVDGYYKLILWLDKRYNSLALIWQELRSFISCPIRVWVCNNRSPLNGGGGDAATNSTAEVDPCSLIPAVDKENADKPGVVEYDTDIGDDPSMQVNPDPSKQRCLGVSRATGTAGRAIITNSYSDWTWGITQ